jgi:hypothetical protein
MRPSDTVLLCKVNISELDDGIRFSERTAVGSIQFRAQCIESPSSEARLKLEAYPHMNRSSQLSD